MNLGELKSQKTFFNPQTQLNHDWFSQKGESGSFDAVLNSKKENFAERAPKASPVNVTMDRRAGVGFKQKAKVDFGPEPNDRDTLKKLVNESVAQNKFQKEVTQKSDVKSTDERTSSKNTIEEELEALEVALSQALGVEEKQPILEKMAEALGISLEVLTEAFEGLMEEVVNTEPMTKVLESLTKDTVINFVEGVKALVEQMPEEKQEKFSQVLSALVETLPDEKVKMPLEVLTGFVAEEKGAVETTEKVLKTDLVAESVDVKVKEAVQNVVSTEATKATMEAESAEKLTKVQGKAETQNAEVPLEAKSMVTEVVKAQTPVTQGISYEEQVNLMKSDAAVISSVKTDVQVPLARHVMNQVIQGTKMSMQMTDQGSEMLIKLNPKNLGNVALKMAFDKGVLLAEIQVENQTVKSIIESNLDLLRNALKEGGYNIGELDVSVNKENTGQDQQSFSQTFQREVTESFEEEQEKIIALNKVNNQEIDYFA